MSAGDLIKREIRVAVSRRAQPAWFRVLKWIILLALITTFWGRPHFWKWMAAALALSLTLHFIWRWKTKGWTRPWGGWDDVGSADGR